MQEISIKHFSELSAVEFHDIIALRIAVFIVEQDCPYQEVDGLDKDAYHLQVIDGTDLVGTLRILKAGVSYPEVAIGRVVSNHSHRDKKIGHLMMKTAMEYVQQKLQANAVRLSAQTHLLGYYQKHGFKSTGKEYLEDGIPHTEMLYLKV